VGGGAERAAAWSVGDKGEGAAFRKGVAEGVIAAPSRDPVGAKGDMERDNTPEHTDPGASDSAGGVGEGELGYGINKPAWAL